MPIARLTVSIPNAFLRSDGPVSTNTYHVDTGATAITEASLTDVATALVQMYQAIEGIYSSGCGSDALITVYDLSDVKPRTAVSVGEFPFDAGADTLPGECAMNVSIRRARAAGVPSQRGRGAIQLGPLNTTALDEATGRISGGAITTVATAIGTWAAAVDAAGFTWVVGSEAQGFNPVVEAHIVNEFGTVGSRQMTASGETAISLPS